MVAKTRQILPLSGAILADQTTLTSTASTLVDGVTVNLITQNGSDTSGADQNIFDRPINLITNFTDTSIRGIAHYYFDSTNSPASFFGHRSRGTRASPTAVQSGDTLASFTGLGYDANGSLFTVDPSVAISLKATETYSSTAHGSQISFFTTANGSLTLTERMNIDQLGRMNINQSASNFGRQLEVSSTTSNPVAFFLQTSTPTTGGLDVLGLSVAATAGDHSWVTFYSDGTTGRGSISYNRGANLTVYNTTSDGRLKKDIVPAQNALSLLPQLQVRSFNWKETGNHFPFGFIAQELHKLYPHAVSVPEDAEKSWGVDNSVLVPLLTKAIQELLTRIEILEAQNG